MKLLALATVLSLTLLPTPATQAKPLCTVMADANTGVVLLEEGDCRTRVTPASTFKIALALMGFDAGILLDGETPELPFRAGYADWGGEEWRQSTTPRRWMKHSVVWFSQQVAATLGMERLRGYTQAFGYGNADFAGDPGKNNGLERAWISSSLEVAPVEQVAFLRNLINRQLPVQPHAIDMTLAVVESWQTPGGWVVSGKTGSAYPRLADGSLDRTKGWGWFVGWAQHDGSTIVFAQLNQDERRESVSGGLRARDLLLGEWDGLVARLARP